ncbi:hypothetical protein CO2235_MP70208 [Cupriavidus oxalaticus]|uniref:Uncharacterized protein n=1 Tax=Cupriavidus oxalaticus TaxID=96344 RepID=A0A375GHA2_9BURK|nr:hypothetical protein CO2235_U880032 [Cupriavidus oxalaticus]SPC23517.1 hypothetical protein CO2235_MP70208 [Cupriavidus oxalaticus]
MGVRSRADMTKHSSRNNSMSIVLLVVGEAIDVQCMDAFASLSI